MGMLGDLLAGLPTEEELAERERKYDEWLRSQWSGLVTDWQSRGMDPDVVSRAEAGLVSQPEPQGVAVGESVDAMEKLQEAAAGAKQAEEDERAALQRETNLSSLRSLEQMPSNKLRQIRAEAKAKGRAGSLGANVQPVEADYAAVGGGGSFSQQTDSPELQQRLAERDEWTAGQPERDLMFAMTPEQAQRRPEYAASAGESLTRLRATKEAERRGQLQEQLVGSLAKGGGKIPFETAMKLDAAGMEVPWRSVGTSPQAAKAQLDDFGRELQSELAKFGSDPMRMMEPGAEQTARYLQYMLSILPQYQQLLEGGMDPDEVGKRFMQIAQRHAADSGTIGFLQMELQKQQPEGK